MAISISSSGRSRLSASSPFQVPLSVTEAAAAQLRPISLANLNETVNNWLRQDFDPSIPMVPGGWEQWAQVSILANLIESVSQQGFPMVDVRRESRVYRDPDSRADLLFNLSTADSTRPMLIVEILGQTPLTSRPDFLNRMHHEAQRLTVENIHPNYASARRLLLAITLDLVTASALQRHGFVAAASTPQGCSAMWREIVE